MTSATLSTTSGAPTEPPRRDWRKVARVTGYVAMALGLVAATASFFILLGLTPILLNRTVILQTIIINGIVVSLLLAVIVWEIGLLLAARRRGRAASRLHLRIAGWFSLVALMPALLVAVVAWTTLDRGLDNWFSTRTQAIIESSMGVAQSGLAGQVEMARRLLLNIKQEAERPEVKADEKALQGLLDQVVEVSPFAAFIVGKDGATILRPSVELRPIPLPPPPAAAVEASLKTNAPQMIAPGEANFMGGVVKLDGYEDQLVFIITPVPAEFKELLELVAANAREYRILQASRFDAQIAFAVLYLIVAMVVILFAIWLGIGFANRLVSPIRQLIDATDQVAKGNLAVAVPVRASEGDVGALAATFNEMTSQLRHQRGALMTASEQIDARRRFSEAVLAGVTAGVVGIDAEGHITVINRMAQRLLAVSDAAVGRDVTDVIPELTPLVTAALHEERPEHRDQITLVRAGRERTINVRVTTESTAADHHGYVVTLDDITDLVTAQRTSAWADVARRIAHEIKNPLTPIQLSAERLKRKFGKVIANDREVFEQCTDTIIRQVGDIGRMVDEFSSFARMPKPAFAQADIAPAIRDAVFLMQVARPDVSFSVTLPPKALVGAFDARLLSQAITNVVKNATEAITASQAEGNTEARVEVHAYGEDDAIVVDVLDTGIGLPQESRQRLLEPYVTTREKGTGLGLAIVRKIIEDHKGKIELLDRQDGHRGALVKITLPAASAAESLQPPEQMTASADAL